VVWVGNADGEGVKGLTGIKKAAPLMFDIWKLLPRSEALIQPIRDLKSRKICSESGYLFGNACSTFKELRIPKQGKHLRLCSYHKVIHLNKEGYRVHNLCEDWNSASSSSRVVLDPRINNYYRKYSGIDLSLPAMSHRCPSIKDQVNILYPENNADILLPTDIDGLQENLVVSISVSQGVDSLYWFFDGEYMGLTQGNHKKQFQPKPGSHQVTVIATGGEQDKVKFRVR